MYENVLTIDNLTKSLYESISGFKGEKRNWELFFHLFDVNAQLFSFEKNHLKNYELKCMTPIEYRNSIGRWLETDRESGFIEYEINKVVQQFVNIAQVFSSYESFHEPEDKNPYMRGVNSFQLIHKEGRWWILNLLWTRETEDFKIEDVKLKY